MKMRTRMRKMRNPQWCKAPTLVLQVGFIKLIPHTQDITDPVTDAGGIDMGTIASISVIVTIPRPRERAEKVTTMKDTV